MDRRMAADLDNYITGHYGEDQFQEDGLTCEACGVELTDEGHEITVATGEKWIVCAQCVTGRK